MSAIFTDIDAPFPLTVEHVNQAEFDAAGLTDWLTPYEHESLQELRTNAVAKRNRQWILGRYVAKLACRRWLKEQGMTVAEWKEIQIENDVNGMPQLSINGVMDSPVVSIAHTGDEAVAAVAAPDNAVGVDIESYKHLNDVQALAKRSCSDSEYQRWFSSVNESEAVERFLQLWLAKESVAKCTGEGLKWRQAKFEVIELNAAEATVGYGEDYYTICFVTQGSTLCAFARLRA